MVSTNKEFSEADSFNFWEAALTPGKQLQDRQQQTRSMRRFGTNGPITTSCTPAGYTC